MIRPRRTFWFVLCVVAGGLSAFLALETAGIPYAALALFAVIWVGRRNRILAESLLAFGATYAIEIFRYAITDLITALQQADYLTATFFAIHGCVAIGIPAAGVTLLARRRSAPVALLAAQDTDRRPRQ